MFNRILSKIGEAAKSPQPGPRSPSHDLDDSSEPAAAAEGFLCPSCMLAFPSPESLQNHYEISHGQEVNGTAETRTQFLCPACKMRFGCDQELQSHIARHHSEKGEKSHDELSFLRKDVDELQTSLKEERLYSEDLKKELGRVRNTLQGAGDESNQATLEIYRSQVRTLEESKTLALSEIVLLKQHLEESRGDKDLLREEKAKLEQKTASLAGDYATVQAHLDEIRSENEMLKSKWSSSQIEIERLSSEVHQRLGAEDAALLRQELVSVQKMMDTLTLQTEAEKDNILKQYKILEEEKMQLQTSLKELQQRGISSVDKSILEEALQQKETFKQELEKGKSEVVSLQDKYSALQAELQEKNSTLQEEISKTVKLLEMQQNLSQQIAQSNLEKERLGFQLTEKEKDILNLEKQLSTSKEQCSSLNSKKEDLQQQLLKNNSQTTDLQQRIEEKDNQVTKLQTELSKFKDTLERLETERTELCSQIEAGDGAKTAIAQLQQENVLLQEQIQQQIQSAASESHVAQKQTDTLTRQLKELTDQHAKLSNKEEKTEAVLQETRASLAEAKSRADQYAEELKAKNEKLLESERSNSALKANFENKSQQHQMLNTKLQNLSEELSRTQGELKQMADNLHQAQLQSQKLKEDSKAQINTLLSEKKVLASSLDSCQANLNTLEQQVKEKESHWKQKFLDLSENIKNLEAKLKEEVKLREEENSTSAERIKMFENETSAYERELSELKAAHEVEQQEGARLKQLLEDAIAEKDSLLTIKQEVESRLSSLEGELKEEHQMKEKSQQQLNSCQAQLIESQEHATRVNKALNDLQELKEEMAERIQQLESECAQLSQTKENLTTLKGKLEHQLEERCKKEQDLVAKGRTLEQKNAKLQEEFTAEKLLAQKALSEMSSVKEAVTIERDKIQAVVQKTKDELKEAKLLHQSELLDSKARLSDAEKHLEECQNQLSICKRTCSEVESQLEEERSQHEAQVCILQENQATLRQDLSQQQDRADDLQVRLADISGQKLEVDAKLENALDDRRALLERCLLSEEECDKLRTTTGELRNKLEDTLAALHELGRENQTLQVENSKLLQRKWTDDSEVTHCTTCKKLFTVTLRKHHCRSCGNIYCNDCSSKTATLASFKKPVRVCESCYNEVSA